MRPRMNCPICGKRMHYNHNDGSWHCPKTKIKNEKRIGCGYKYNPNAQWEFKQYRITEKDKKNIIKSLGGKSNAN